MKQKVGYQSFWSDIGLTYGKPVKPSSSAIVKTGNRSKPFYSFYKTVSCPSGLQFKRYIQRCTLSRVLILIMTSQLSKLMEGLKYIKSITKERNMSFLQNEKQKVLNCASKTTFSEVIVFWWR